MEQDKLIQKQLSNQLTNTEQVTFDQLLASDSNFKKTYESHLDIHRGIHEHERIALKSQLQSLHQKQSKRNSYLVFGLIIIAAILSLLAAFFLWNKKPSSEAIFAQYATVYPNTYAPVTRDAKTDKQMLAFQFYESENFTAATPAFQELLESKNNSDLRFYYAMSLFNTENLEHAKQELQQVISSADTQFATQAKWYLALIYLRKNQLSDCRFLLEELQIGSDDYKKEEIKALLEQLDKYD